MPRKKADSLAPLLAQLISEKKKKYCETLLDIFSCNENPDTLLESLKKSFGIQHDINLPPIFFLNLKKRFPQTSSNMTESIILAFIDTFSEDIDKAILAEMVNE